MKSILDRSFQYTPARLTDLKKTFARIRREQRAREEAEAQASAAAAEEQRRKVRRIQTA